MSDSPGVSAQGETLSDQARRLRQQLARLEALRNKAEQHDHLSTADEVNLRTVRQMEARIREDLRAVEMLEADADAEFTLAGDPVYGHEVSAKFLGDFLRSLQDLVYATTQVVVGQPTSRAPVRGDIIATSRLTVLPQFVAGSFGFRVRLPREEELGLLPGSLEANREALRLVGDILGDRLADEELATRLSHSRVRSHYAKLMSLLAEENADIVVRTRANPSGSKIQARRARERREWLNLLQMTTRAVTLEGRLVGGSIERRRFELAAEDGIDYAGTISEQAAEEMRHLHWGDSVRARLEVTTQEHEDVAGEPAERYHAKSFTLLPALPESGSHDQAFRCGDGDNDQT